MFHGCATENVRDKLVPSEKIAYQNHYKRQAVFNLVVEEIGFILLSAGGELDDNSERRCHVMTANLNIALINIAYFPLLPRYPNRV